MRACLRLWKPVRYSSLAAGSKVISTGAVEPIFLFFEGGGISKIGNYGDVKELLAPDELSLSSRACSCGARKVRGDGERFRR